MPDALKPDDRLLEWATPTQKKYFDAVKKHGSGRKAAKALGVNQSTISGCMKALEMQARQHGYDPKNDLTHPTAAPFVVKGTSTLYGDDGKQKLQWVKTKIDENMLEEVLREFVTSALAEVRGTSKIVTPPKFTSPDLMTVIPIGDPHFGMYAWAAEAGADFDLEIAERVTKGAIDRLVTSAPESDTAIILPLGDVFHANDDKGITPGHGNQLDVDSRYPKVMATGIVIIRYIIERALERFKKVVVRVEPGNHDPQAKWALTLTLSAIFENNPRVEVDLSPSKFWFYQFGKVLIGSTHGDTVKHEQLPGVMAADQPQAWGSSAFRYWYTGHVHTQAVREFPGVVCESFKTLAPADAWAAAKGYRAGRDMFAIVHHREFGEVERHRCDIAMLRKG